MRRTPRDVTRQKMMKNPMPSASLLRQSDRRQQTREHGASGTASSKAFRDRRRGRPDGIRRAWLENVDAHFRGTAAAIGGEQPRKMITLLTIASQPALEAPRSPPLARWSYPASTPRFADRRTRRRLRARSP